MKNLKDIASRLADQIHAVSSESEIQGLIERASEESGFDYASLYRSAGNVYYDRYERKNRVQQNVYCEVSNKR